VIKRVGVSTQAQADLAEFDRVVALRIAGAIHRFAATGATDATPIAETRPRCRR
jgi:hypothetical protein